MLNTLRQLASLALRWLAATLAKFLLHLAETGQAELAR
jgi:hypothetical protein